MQVKVDTPQVFRPGDVVARYDSGAAGSLPVVIDSIDSNDVLLLASALDHLVKGDTLGAANLGPTYGITSVQGSSVTVATPEGFTPGDVAVQLTGGVLANPVPIDSIAQNVLRLRSPMAGLQTTDFLVPARFPRIVTVTQAFVYGNFVVVEVDGSGAMRAGDLLMRVADSTAATAADLAMVFSAGGTVLILASSMAGLKMGDQLALVSFSVADSVIADPAAGGLSLTTNGTFDPRPGDVAGPLAAYAETSRVQSISKIQANTLTLGAPIDGLNAGDLIGPASFSPELNRLRFANVDDIRPGDRLELDGLDTALMQPQSSQIEHRERRRWNRRGHAMARVRRQHSGPAGDTERRRAVQCGLRRLLRFFCPAATGISVLAGLSARSSKPGAMPRYDCRSRPVRRGDGLRISMLIERLQFFNGQRLTADDLESINDFNEEMRLMHNSSLHPSGVASGYAITGNKGNDRQVTIQPGYALDSTGHEIILTQSQVLAVPPVANDGYGNPVQFDLTVSYPEASDLVETETRVGVCVGSGAVRLRESPVFCWMRLPVSTAVQKAL